jgi:hypothetical protein
VTIDDSPICCEAPRQALERPQDATWPGQGEAGAGIERSRVMWFEIWTPVTVVLVAEVAWIARA